MRIFITGANGQLGRSVVKNLNPSNELFIATKEKLDVSDKKAVSKMIGEFHPDFVFHFASLTRGDDNAKNPDKAKQINVIGTKNIVTASKRVNAGVLFVSTNEVFDGNTDTPYREDDSPNPITVAGKLKLEAENIIREEMEKYYIIRSMWLYSQWSSNFIHNVLQKARKDKKVQVVEDEIGSPTYSSDLAIGIEKLLHSSEFGTYHLVNEGVASRLDFAKKAFMICNIKDVEITPVKLENFKRASIPPRYSSLENVKAKSLGIKLRPWSKALKSFLVDNNMLQ